MSVASQFAFLYPYFSDAADPRYVDPSLVATATAAAEDYRPACLSTDRGDLAVAHYTAHLLQARADRLAAGSASGAIAATGMVKSEKEGGVEVTYMTASEQSGIAVVRQAGTLSPYEEWKRLAALCRVGFTVSPRVTGPGWP